jgi:opacity protein-like surface antigen
MRSTRSLIFTILFIAASSSSAYSETYFSFGAGASIVGDYSRVKLGGAASANYRDVHTHNSFAYEFKAGHFVDNFKLRGFEFGLELNYLVRDLDATTQVVDSDFENTEHLGFRVNSFQTLSIIPLVRYKYGNFEPYIGMGLAVNLLDIEEISLGNTTINTVKIDQGLSDNYDFGMMVAAGLKYQISEKFKIYSEYKYSQSSYNLFLNKSPNTDFNLAVETHDQNIMIGLTYSLELF